MFFSLWSLKLTFGQVTIFTDSRIASSIVTTKTTAKRGTIYDSNHEVIAQDRKAYTIVAYLDDSLVDSNGNPNYVEDIHSTVKQLKSVLGDSISEKTIKKLLNRQKNPERHRQN